MAYYFNTLHEALESENLLHTLPYPDEILEIPCNDALRYRYKETVVIVTRCPNGRYERPIHYKEAS